MSDAFKLAFGALLILLGYALIAQIRQSSGIQVRLSPPGESVICTAAKRVSERRISRLRYASPNWFRPCIRVPGSGRVSSAVSNV